MSPRKTAPRDAVGQAVDPDEVYVCIESFASGIVTGGFGREGNTYRGRDPLVQAHPWQFARQGTPRNELPSPWPQYEPAEPYAPQPPPPPHIPAARAKVALRHVGGGRVVTGRGAVFALSAGQRAAKDSDVVKNNRASFVDCLPEGVELQRAALCTHTCTNISDDGEHTCHAGQYIDRDDLLVRVNPQCFTSPAWDDLQ